MKHTWKLSYKIRERVQPIESVTNGRLLDGGIPWLEEHEYYNEAIASVENKIEVFKQSMKTSNIEYDVTEHYAIVVGEEG